MRIVYPGDDIIFAKNFINSVGDPVDPPDVTFRIAKNANQFLSIPQTYSNGQVHKNVIGSYGYTYSVPTFVTPSIYNARWDAVIDGVNSVTYEQFQVSERPPISNTLLDPPRTYGVMMESSLYQTLNVGETDTIFLVGHADGLALNDPYQVYDMQTAINVLGAHQESPLVRALLECYNTGSRDVWLVASAPETEYVPWDFNNPDDRFTPREEWGGKNFYELYYDRLTETYNILKDYDIPEIIVPVEAPFYKAGNVDFLSQLINHCEEAYTIVSIPRIGIIGSRVGNQDQAVSVQDLEADDRFTQDYGAGGKFVMTVYGEGTFKLPQMPISHTSSLAVSVAALLSISPFNAGATYKILRNVVSLYGRELTKTEVKTLSLLRVNPAVRTVQGKRGNPYQIVAASDNTMSSEGSDFWSVVQMRLVTSVISQIKQLANRSLGTIGFMQFRQDVSSYLQGLVAREQIRTFNLSIERDAVDMYKAIVEVSLSPFFGVREIFFQIQVGPGV